MSKILTCEKRFGLSMLMNRCPAICDSRRDPKDTVKDGKREYAFDEPGQRKCAMMMMMHLIVYMCATGVLHVGNYDEEDCDDIKDQVQLKARGGATVGVECEDDEELNIINQSETANKRKPRKNGSLAQKWKSAKLLHPVYAVLVILYPLQQVYSFTITAMIWASFVRSMLTLRYNQTESAGLLPYIDRIVLTTWNFLAAMSSTIMFIASNDKNRLKRFFRTWSNYSETRVMRKIERVTKIATWTSIVLVTVLVAINGCVLTVPLLYMRDLLDTYPELHRFFVEPISEPFYSIELESQRLSANLTTNATQNSTKDIATSNAIDFVYAHPSLFSLSFITYMYATFSWLLTPFFFFLICYIINHELSILKEQYDEYILKPASIDECNVPRIFESLRARHAGLCDMIALVDDIFCLFLFVSFSCNLIISCCLGYRILKLIRVIHAVRFVGPVVWTLMSFCQLTILCIGSGKVNEAAHALFDSVYLTSFKEGASPEMLSKINIFLQKLQGPSIGFTAWKLYVVDKSSCLTVGSTFVAYLVVLLTFPS